MAALIPHLQRALRLHGALAVLRSSNEGLERALDAFDRAVVGLNGSGKVLFCNQAAQRLLAETDGLRVEKQLLTADLPPREEKLQLLLKQCAVAGKGFTGPGGFLIERRSGRPALRLSIMPFAGNLLGYIPGLAVLVFIDDPGRKPPSRSVVLRMLFRLPPMETRIVDLLTAGNDLPTVADILKMSGETARSHLKSIFRKTGAKRQADLVRMALSLPSFSI